jgi:CelD/BcsL family acetyltransferase involved in cellulose biosynthesis
MIYRIVEGNALSSELTQRWDEILVDNLDLDSPYFQPGFTQAVAAVRTDVFVAIMEESGQTVGFFPFQRARFGIGRAVGGALCDFQGAVARPGIQWSAKALIRSCGLKLWSFDHLLASQSAFSEYHTKTIESPYIDLSAGFDTYALERRASGSEQIKKTGNLRRRLEREVGPLRFEIHEPSSNALRTLLKWKSKQYLSSGLTDVFAVPWTVQLLEKLLNTQSHDFAGMLSTLYAGDRLIAAHFGMRSRFVLHYWYPAYDREFQRYSPGMILLLKMAEAVPSMGIRKIDMAKGDSMYKQRLTSGTTVLAEGAVEIPSLTVAIRRLRRNAELWVRDTPFERVARIPGRTLRRMERELRFR